MTDPTQPFSNRVENYTKYRPSYPPEILDLLKNACGLSPDSVIADIGSGTGMLSRLFLDNGNRVFGIEPNEEMNQAGKRLLSSYPNFISIRGTAEHTALEENSVYFVTAGQSFHWFEIETAREEFERILKPNGWVVLVWNSRRYGSSTFLTDYERILRTYGTDYADADRRRETARMAEKFFEVGTHFSETIDNKQSLDFEGLKGRLLSSSYMPVPGEPGCVAMLNEAERAFLNHQVDGNVTINYDTRVYYGQLAQ